MNKQADQITYCVRRIKDLLCLVPLLTSTMMEYICQLSLLVCQETEQPFNFLPVQSMPFFFVGRCLFYAYAFLFFKGTAYPMPDKDLSASQGTCLPRQSPVSGSRLRRRIAMPSRPPRCVCVIVCTWAIHAWSWFIVFPSTASDIPIIYTPIAKLGFDPDPRPISKYQLRL